MIPCIACRRAAVTCISRRVTAAAPPRRCAADNVCAAVCTDAAPQCVYLRAVVCPMCRC